MGIFDKYYYFCNEIGREIRLDANVGAKYRDGSAASVCRPIWCIMVLSGRLVYTVGLCIDYCHAGKDETVKR